MGFSSGATFLFYPAKRVPSTERNVIPERLEVLDPTPASECTDEAGAVQSSSALASFVARGTALGQPEQQDAEWLFGLYQGIDFDHGGVILKNPVQCIFRKYPIDAAIPLFECLDYVYLPTVSK